MKKNLLVLIVLLFCPGISFAGNYYISPSGSDAANGLSEPTAWKSFSRAVGALKPNDTLILLDGTYSDELKPTVSGVSGQPITFKAKNRGKAIIQRDTDGPAISVYSIPTKIMSYLEFDGIISRSMGEYNAITINSQDNSTEEQMTHHITIKNCGAFGSANMLNTVTFALGRVRDSLIEDSFSYGFGRKSFQLYGCLRVTVRRFVARYDFWDGYSYKPNDPRIGFAVYNSHDGIFENIISLDNAPDPTAELTVDGVARTSASKAGFAIEGNLASTVLLLGSDGNMFKGILSLANYGAGIYSSGVSTGQNNNNILRDFISWGNTYSGVQLQAQSSYNTLLFGTMGYSTASSGLSMYDTSVDYNTISNSVMIGNAKYGINISAGGTHNTFTNNSILSNASGSVIESSYAPTFNYLIRPTMVAGHERGGTMVNRYVDGVLTTSSLWPWPNEDLIRQHMCNPTDLAKVHRVAANGAGWAPAWCESGKTLTKYIWEFLGNTIPANIYGAPAPPQNVIRK